MDLFANLMTGFGAAVTPMNLLFALIGCLVGTCIGVLPGIGPVATVAMLLPMTFHLEPLAGLIMLSGIFYGAQYGGSTTAILVNLPGETSAVVTCIDGYQMARRGRAGVALAVAALGSFFAGTIATFVIALAAPPLSLVGRSFGGPEYFALMLFGLIAAVALAHGSILKAIAMIFLGILLGLVGTDQTTGNGRFSFDIPVLADGIGFVPLAIGVFGIGEIISNLKRGTSNEERSVLAEKITGLWPTPDDFRRSWPAWTRGTVLGSILGILPGGGATLSAFASYVLEKRVSKNPEEFGNGAIEGVAGPEAANNAGAQTSFIPMLTLGIPSNPVMALMIGAMIIQGIQPGPSVITEQPALFWGIIVSMWIGNFFLIVLNLPLIGLWVRMIMVPYHYLYPVILVFCGIGVFSLNNSDFDIHLMALFGFLGYVFAKLDCEPAPMLLGFILGPLMEEYLRRAFIISHGNPAVFFTSPISATMLVLAAVTMVIVLLPAIRRKRDVAFQEEA